MWVLSCYLGVARTLNTIMLQKLNTDKPTCSTQTLGLCDFWILTIVTIIDLHAAQRGHCLDEYALVDHV